MRRVALGVLSILFVVVGLALYLFFSGESSQKSAFAAVLVRVGAVLAALWLAYPHLSRASGTLWIGILVLAAALARSRALVPVVVVVLIAIAILKPRSLMRATPTSTSDEKERPANKQKSARRQN